MKKLFVVLLALSLLCASAVAEGIDWASMTDEELASAIDAAQAVLKSRPFSQDDVVHTEGLDYKLLPFTKDSVDGVEVVMMSVDWINTSDEPDCFNSLGFRVECYQNGKEIENTYITNAGGIFDNYMPGYGCVCNIAYENADDSEMTFFVYNYRDMDYKKTEIKVYPSELQ